MIASVVLQNIVYLAGAVVVAVVLGVAVTLRHRRPKSVEANMESFNKGLRALAPGAQPAKRRRGVVPSPTTPVHRASTVVPDHERTRLRPARGESDTG